MVALNSSIIANSGMYTREQVSGLARVSRRTLDRWLGPSGGGRPAAVTRHMPDNDDGVYGFVDLIQLVAVRSIRLEAARIPFERIRQARASAAQNGHPYPFVADLRVFTFGRDLFIKTRAGELIGASGVYKQQHMLEPILQPYLRELVFGPDGLANEFRPLPGILLTPKYAYGSPTVEGTGYTVESLVRAYRAEGDFDRAAQICGVQVEAIQTAMTYEDMLVGRA